MKTFHNKLFATFKVEMSKEKIDFIKQNEIIAVFMTLITSFINLQRTGNVDLRF